MLTMKAFVIILHLDTYQAMGGTKTTDLNIQTATYASHQLFTIYPNLTLLTTQTVGINLDPDAKRKRGRERGELGFIRVLKPKCHRAVPDAKREGHQMPPNRSATCHTRGRSRSALHDLSLFMLKGYDVMLLISATLQTYKSYNYDERGDLDDR